MYSTKKGTNLTFFSLQVLTLKSRKHVMYVSESWAHHPSTWQAHATHLAIIKSWSEWAMAEAVKTQRCRSEKAKKGRRKSKPSIHYSIVSYFAFAPSIDTYTNRNAELQARCSAAERFSHQLWSLLQFAVSILYQVLIIASFYFLCVCFSLLYAVALHATVCALDFLFMLYKTVNLMDFLLLLV